MARKKISDEEKRRKELIKELHRETRLGMGRNYSKSDFLP